MRTTISRLLLAALVVAGVVAIGRLAIGVSHPADAVHLDGLDAEALAHAAFTVGEGGARVAVHAVGSFEGLTDAPGAAPPLAAYGWLVRRGTDSAAWRPHPRRRPERGSVFSVRDTVALAPGVYDAYFAAYGDPLVRATAPASDRVSDRVRAALSRGGRAWLGESDRWRFVVSGATAADRARLRRRDDAPTDARTGAVWASGPVGSGQTAETLLRVEAGARVRLRATTEVTDGVVADSATLVRLDAALGDSAAVWTAGPRGGRWAGGSLKNRAFDTTLALAPGLYRVRFAADRSHAAGDWAANPPFVPSSWGVRVDAAAGARIAAFSLDSLGTAGLPEIARVDCAGPTRTERVAFTLAAPVTAVVLAVGEMSSESSRYDFATLDRLGGVAGAETVWTMSYDRTEPAGGADRNRRETAVVPLAAGRYELRYQTDGSHDCADNFPDGAPDGGQWGVHLSAASPGFRPETVRVEPPTPPPGGDSSEMTRELDRILESLPDGGAGSVLANLTVLGPDTETEATFTLAANGPVRIVAVGELLPSERLDWGWIEDADGETVWEMTRANTEPAGGAAKNRRFDGLILLTSGTYTVHFETNDRHDAERFDGGPPRDPAEWGIRVWRVSPHANRVQARD